jgi:hypothetical protein
LFIGLPPKAACQQLFLQLSGFPAFLLLHISEVGIFSDLTEPDTDFTIAFELVNIFHGFDNANKYTF